jgi:uncharacterized protein (TIRG00374 family)
MMHPSDTSGKKDRRPSAGMARTAAGYLVAALALVWVFHDVNFSLLEKEVSGIIWPLAILGMCVDVGRYATQSVRWNLLLRPLGTISVAKTFQALYTGIFLNLVFPLRIGEIARAYLASRHCGARFPAVVSSLFTEYLFDGVWLALGIGVAALFVKMPVEVAGIARVLGCVILASICLFLLLLFHKKRLTATRRFMEQTGIFSFRPVRGAVSFFHTIRGGLKTIGGSRFFWLSFALSSFDLMFHILAFWIIMIAYGIHLPFLSAAAVLLFVFVGLIIPNAPSNAGAFQFLCVIGLLAFGIDKTMASGFSVLVFIMVNIPQVVIGWLAFSRSGHTLYEIKKTIASLRLKGTEE